MKKPISDIAFTPSVKAIQEKLGSRENFARVEEEEWWSDKVDDRLSAFIAERDSFYIATASKDGQPYIQHRGGPKGFLRVSDERTLAFADFKGNHQYISYGNLEENDKICLFLMDYPNRRRVKIWGTANVVADEPNLMQKLTNPNYPGQVERAFIIHLKAWDTNCPQHILPRYTHGEIHEADECPGCEPK